jgi:hypothetical protein
MFENIGNFCENRGKSVVYLAFDFMETTDESVELSKWNIFFPERLYTYKHYDKNMN